MASIDLGALNCCLGVVPCVLTSVPQAFFGTSLTLADGVFTPAVSVTSAVSGIAVAKPDVSKDVIPISVVSLCSTSLFG